MIEAETMTVPRAQASTWTANPYLHYEESRIYNPLTDRSLLAEDLGSRRFRLFQEQGVAQIFTPGASTQDVVEYIRGNVRTAE